MTRDAARRILLVDDIEANRVALELELAEAGFAVTSAGSGNAAAALIDKGFDALVTDIWMPDGDGIELLRTLRARAPGMLVYAVTGGGPGMSLASASSLAKIWDARRVYIKPFDVRTLVADLRGDLGV